MRLLSVPAVAVLVLMLSPVRADVEPVALFKELVDSNTAPSGGYDTTGVVATLEKHLRAAGFGDDELTVVDLGDRAHNLVVRYRSPRPQLPPVLLMAHLDVVEAKPSDWSFDPFDMIERDGYYYGRGTIDNKAGAAIIVATLIRMKREGYAPSRDFIAMLTGDEETTGAGALWLATEGRELIDAAFALNSDAGSVVAENGRAKVFGVQTSEKVYVSFRLTATDPGGHSSRPRPDNPIYRVARALAAQQQHAFPVDLNDTTTRYFEHRVGEAAADEAAVLEAVLAGDRDAGARLPDYAANNAMARTTCVATQIEGGHAENALPQTATAVVNCRVLPQADVQAVRATLERLAAPHDVAVEQIAEAKPSPPSPLSPEVLGPISDVARELWPGIEIVPTMSTGATDGLFVRSAGIPVYGVSALALDPAENRAHGREERLPVRAFEDALVYWYRLLRRLGD